LNCILYSSSTDISLSTRKQNLIPSNQNEKTLQKQATAMQAHSRRTLEEAEEEEESGKRNERKGQEKKTTPLPKQISGYGLEQQLPGRGLQAAKRGPWRGLYSI